MSLASIGLRLMAAAALLSAVANVSSPAAGAEPTAPADFVALADVDPMILQDIPGEPLTDCAGPQRNRFPDNTIDMDTGYDCFDTLAHTLDPRVQGDQLKNRLLLKDGLEKHGLVNYENEWWHFTFKPEVYPDTYFDFPIGPSL